MPKKQSFPIFVFADGASSGNPGPGGWGAILVLPEGKVFELGGREEATTNNRMELAAVIEALRKILLIKSIPQSIEVYTDSVYVIRGITQWIWGWQRNGWRTSQGEEVSNQDLWKNLRSQLMNLGKAYPVSWKYVRGHSGVPGNERVDEIAVAFSKNQWPKLYEGPLLGYSVPIHDVPEDTELPESSSSREEKKAAYSYLSLIDGVIMRHSTWKDCESRIKGRSGAKFKKAMSAQEEEKIVNSWGYELNRIQNDPQIKKP